MMRSKLNIICICIVVLSLPLSDGKARNRRAEQRGSNKADAVQSSYNTSYACEGETMNITCPPGFWINIIRANYGRFSLNICNENEVAWADTQCLGSKSSELMMERCNMLFSCLIVADDNTFGDTCPETYKYLEAIYECRTFTTTSTSTTTTSTRIESSSSVTNRGKNTVVPINPNVRMMNSNTYVGSTPEATKVPIANIAFGIDDGLVEPEAGICPEIVQRNIVWPASKNSQLVQRKCPQSPLNAQWICSQHGEWIDLPDLSRCTSLDLLPLFEQMSHARNYEYLASSIDAMKNEIKQKEDLYGGDIIEIVGGLEKISHSYEQYDTEYGVQTALDLNKAVIDGMNDLIKPARNSSWYDLSRDQKKFYANCIVKTIESNALVLSKVAAKTEAFRTSNIVLEVGVVQPSEYVAFPSLSLYHANLDTIQLPNEVLLAGTNDKGTATVIFVSYDYIGAYMKPEPAADNIERIVASKLLSASVPNAGQQSKLSEPVLITFTISQATNLTNPTCVYWHNGGHVDHWSTDGCHRIKFNGSHVSCACNHLTIFAVLMDIRGVHLDDVHRLALTFVSLIGCAISAVALTLSLLAFWLLRGYTGDRATIHKNLCFCLLIAETTFLLGISETDKRLVCGLVAGLLHYFFLAAFAWMLLEGFQLYVLLAEVFESGDKNRKKYFYSFAYGMPLIIVVISLCVDYNSYGTSSYCWLNTDNYFVFSFVGPVVVVLMANFVFLSMALVIMCKHSGVWSVDCKRHSPIRSNMQNVAAWLKAAFVLIFLLGLTWTFGLFYVSEQTKVVAYIFCALNSMQGVFIFVFHVLLNDRMRNEFQKWLRRSDWLPGWVRSGALSSQVDQQAPGSSNDCRLGGPNCVHGIMPVLPDCFNSTVDSKKSLPFLLKCFYSMTSGRTEQRSTSKRLFDHTDLFSTVNQDYRDKPLFSYQRDDSSGNCVDGYNQHYLNCAHFPTSHRTFNNIVYHHRPSAPNFPPPEPPIDPTIEILSSGDQHRLNSYSEAADIACASACAVLAINGTAYVPSCSSFKPVCASYMHTAPGVYSATVVPACALHSYSVMPQAVVAASDSVPQISPVRSEPDSGYCDGVDSLLNKTIPSKLPNAGDCDTTIMYCGQHHRCLSRCTTMLPAFHLPTNCQLTHAASNLPLADDHSLRYTVCSDPVVPHQTENSLAENCTESYYRSYGKQSNFTQTSEQELLLPPDVQASPCDNSITNASSVVCAYEIPLGQKLDESVMTDEPNSDASTRMVNKPSRAQDFSIDFN